MSVRVHCPQISAQALEDFDTLINIFFYFFKVFEVRKQLKSTPESAYSHPTPQSNGSVPTITQGRGETAVVV